ncbi:MAG: RNA polymerase sigma factor [Chloroflexi bacterium]|nr:RNA polymerase sigma factor [Chloroflexota bacterium]MDA1174207.1 RNA polymerase sigma factor [Chloroflexota bacterium]
MDDATAIARVREGHIDAFADVVDRYEVPILRYLTRMTGDAELARDLAQDTFLQAFKNIMNTKSELSLKAWLYKIATNNALQHHRRRKILSFIPFLNSAETDIPEPGSGPEWIDAKVDVQRALLGVPTDQRAALVLHYVEGLKYDVPMGFGGRRALPGRDHQRRHHARFRRRWRRPVREGGTSRRDRGHREPEHLQQAGA